MPKVSVILTSFNHDKYIREAIDSVLKQTFVDFELIIWDDASSDDSWEIIQSYDDARIRAFQNPQNEGPVFGINKAISEIADGEYIAIHHSDDIWELDKLAKQVEFLDANQSIGAVFSNAQPIDQRGMLLTDQTHFYFNIFDQVNRSRYEWLRFFFNQANALCHPSVLIRKQCYQDCGMYRPLLAQLPDFDMWIRLCLKYDIHILSERLVRFRVHDQEANTSGSRLDTRIRWRYEYYKVLANYQAIQSFAELVNIFPDAQKYDRGEATPNAFVLAIMALEQKTEPFITLFAQDILFQILSDSKQALLIKQLYDFDVLSFIKLTAQHDIFSREEVNDLYQKLTEHEKQFNNMVHEHESVLKAVQARENSWSSKIINSLRVSPVGRIGRRIVKVLWWTVTLQLFSKWNEWQSLKNGNTTEEFHVAPLTNYCIAVPFNYTPEKPAEIPSVAVICHLYYVELLEEFKSYLANIPVSFDLFISTDSEEKKAAISNELQNWNKGNVEIRLAPNRGRDIAPKLVTFHDVYERYEFFLHIHSKKSPHAEDVTAGWRTYLLETLLGSEKIVSSIFAAFASDAKLGMIAPEHFEPIRAHVGWGRNFNAAEQFAKQLGITLSLQDKIDFPSGSMFWGRSAAIKPLLALNLTTEDFPPEQQQIDTTLAHVIERLYFFICEQAGYQWIKIANPFLLLNMLPVENENSLIAAIKDAQYNLLLSSKESDESINH